MFKKILLVLIVVSNSLLAQKVQKTTIRAGEKGTVVRKNTYYSMGCTVYRNSFDKDEYVLGVKPGFATQMERIDSIFAKNQLEYTMQLSPLTPLPKDKVKRKITFSGMIDKTRQVNDIEYTSAYTYRHMGLQELFAKDVLEELTSKNFKVAEEDLFKSKNSDSDYALAGEIIEYKENSRGPGFMIVMVIKWTLFDLRKEETVLRVTTAGYSNTGTRQTLREVERLAVRDALGGFMANNELQSLVLGAKAEASGPKNLISIKKVLPPAGEGNYIEKAIQASVTITSGRGHGSGFLISSSGYVLTNFHVVEDSVDLQAIFQNGLNLPLEIVSFDEEADVALCKVPGKGYAAMPLDTVSVMKKIGSDVVAIGTPEDITLGQSVTKGIISGLRDIQDHMYIQTDVTINSGNSGGMLINSSGNVVGIVSAKIKGNGVEGLGFAIPINVALKALNIKISE